MFDVIITVNSPGELFSLVKPSVAKIKLKHPEARIILVIPPCQYATGREAEIAGSFLEISRVVLPREYLRWILLNVSPSGLTFSNQGVVVFMGGDLFHAVLLSKKLNFPALAYICHRIAWDKFFRRFLLSDARIYKEAIRKGTKLEKLKIVGELMVDSATPTKSKEETLKIWNIDPQKPIVTLFVGSRKFQYQYMTSFLIRVTELIQEKFPEVQFVLTLSPFVDISEIQKYLNPQSSTDKIYKEQTNLPCQIVKADLYRSFIVNEQGLKILLVEGSQYDILNITDVLLTVPGTNTAEAAALGTPLVCILPLNKPEVLPLEGSLELLSKIPGIGKYLKIFSIKLSSKMIKYFALPNIKANQEIVPEIKGVLEPSQVASVALKLLKDSGLRQKIRRQLLEVMGGPGAAERVVEEIYETVRKTAKIS